MTDPSQQQYRPFTAGGNMRGGRVPPRQQHQQRALPKQLQQQHQQRRAAASRPQPVQKQPPRQPQYRQQVRHQPPPQGYNGGGRAENYVGQLEGALQSMRYEREREYRGRNAAQERLRAEAEKLQGMRLQVEEERAKNQKLVKEKATVKNEIYETEFSIKEVAMKYEFTHQDKIRKQEKIAEDKGVVERGHIKQENALEQGWALKEHEGNIFKSIEEKDSKATVFNVLLGKRERMIEEKNSTESNKRRKLCKDPNDERLLRGLQALYAQSCVMMITGMIKNKAVSVLKEAEHTHAAIAHLKASEDGLPADPNDQDFQPQMVAKFSESGSIGSTLARDSSKTMNPAIAFNNHEGKGKIRM